MPNFSVAQYPNFATKNFANARNQMVDKLMQKGIEDSRVLTALREIPRHIFIDENSGFILRSYDDAALPIDCNQTISQPYIVALMTQLLLAGEKPLGKVLEIGTGCGYQTALLAVLVKQVYSIERIWKLKYQASSCHRQLGLSNITYEQKDGHEGWPEEAPFDGIIVTAAARAIPEPLTAQLADKGRLVIPIGEPSGMQRLMLVIREGQDLLAQDLLAVYFVPMLTGVIDG